jgi:hypothetical protein
MSTMTSIKTFKEFVSEASFEDTHAALVAQHEKSAAIRKAKMELDARTADARKATMDAAHKENMARIAANKPTAAQIEQDNKNHVATADDNRKHGRSND